MADQQQREPNYMKEAVQGQYNLIGLAGAVAASVLSLNPLPLRLHLLRDAETRKQI